MLGTQFLLYFQNKVLNTALWRLWHRRTFGLKIWYFFRKLDIPVQVTKLSSQAATFLLQLCFNSSHLQNQACVLTQFYGKTYKEQSTRQQFTGSQPNINTYFLILIDQKKEYIEYQSCGSKVGKNPNNSEFFLHLHDHFYETCSLKHLRKYLECLHNIWIQRIFSNEITGERLLSKVVGFETGNLKILKLKSRKDLEFFF